MNTSSNPLAVRKALFLLPALLLLGACAQTRVVDNWQTDAKVDHKPEKVAVIAVLPESLLRKAVEIDVAKILSDKGTPAVPGSNIPGMSGGIRGEIDTQVATEMLTSAGVDGVIVMFYAGSGGTQEYERSDYWAEYVGSGVGYNWANPYFVDVYTVHKGAGWADSQNSALVESSYFDLETKKPVWRIVTRTKDTEHADGASDIAKQIASEMRSAGLN